LSTFPVGRGVPSAEDPYNALDRGATKLPVGQLVLEDPPRLFGGKGPPSIPGRESRAPFGPRRRNAIQDDGFADRKRAGSARTFGKPAVRRVQKTRWPPGVPPPGGSPRPSEALAVLRSLVSAILPPFLTSALHSILGKPELGGKGLAAPKGQRRLAPNPLDCAALETARASPFFSRNTGCPHPISRPQWTRPSPRPKQGAGNRPRGHGRSCPGSRVRSSEPIHTPVLPPSRTRHIHSQETPGSSAGRRAPFAVPKPGHQVKTRENTPTQMLAFQVIGDE